MPATPRSLSLDSADRPGYIWCMGIFDSPTSEKRSYSNPAAGVQKSLWARLQHVGYAPPVAGQMAWLLVRAGVEGMKGHSAACAEVHRASPSAVARLLECARATAMSKKCVEDAKRAAIAGRIVRTLEHRARDLAGGAPVTPSADPAAAQPVTLSSDPPAGPPQQDQPGTSPKAWLERCAARRALTKALEAKGLSEDVEAIVNATLPLLPLPPERSTP